MKLDAAKFRERDHVAKVFYFWEFYEGLHFGMGEFFPYDWICVGVTNNRRTKADSKIGELVYQVPSQYLIHVNKLKVELLS